MKPQASESVRVWDPFVRVAHWLLAAGVLLAYATGDELERWHERLGYAVLAIVALRVAWGFVGPRTARFADFVRAPRVVAAYARDLLRLGEPRHLGHNPLGGWSIVALLALAAASGASGWALTVTGEESRLGEAVEEAHEAISNALIAFVALHLAGVAWASLRHGENLVGAMVTGRKARRPGEDSA